MSWSSFELKRSYQRFLGLSVVLSGLGFILLALWFSFISLSRSEGERVIRTITIAKLTTPPFIVIPDESTESPVVEGIPVPTSKAQELKIRIGKQPYRGEVYHGIVPDPSLLNVAASSDNGWVRIKSFSSQKMRLVEPYKLPECCYIVLPGYPDSARVYKIEADVLFLVLIDEEGRVREVVVKSSKPGWGFAEAMADAVAKWEYRPAISGDKKGVWFAYKVKFEIKQG